tara:strand:- start:371 stop:1603 length:1233 start_codon:yes stop_codon:yes gene_type:complete
MKIGFISKNLIKNNSEALSLLLEHCLKNDHDLDLIYSDCASIKFSIVANGNLLSIINNQQFFNSTLFINDSRELGDNLPSFIRMIIQLSRNNIKIETFNKSVNDIFQDGVNKLGYSRPLNEAQIKIKESINLKSRRGQVLGRIPFGYKKSISSGYQVDLDGSKIIEQIFSLYSGEFGRKKQIGLRKIVKILNNNKNKNAKKWNTQTIKNILKNRFYTGIYKRGVIIISGNHEPIISSYKFEFVQGLLKDTDAIKKIKKNNKDPNKINLICWYCKSPILKSSHSRKWVNINRKEVKKVYSYFECKSYYCKSKNRNKFKADQVFKILEENKNSKFAISNLLLFEQQKYTKLINVFKQNIKLLIRGKYTLDNLEIDLDELQSMESDLNLNSNLTESKKNYIQVKKDKVKVLTA